jgi:hypothetical protein
VWPDIGGLAVLGEWSSLDRTSLVSDPIQNTSSLPVNYTLTVRAVDPTNGFADNLTDSCIVRAGKFFRFKSWDILEKNVATLFFFF